MIFDYGDDGKDYYAIIIGQVNILVPLDTIQDFSDVEDKKSTFIPNVNFNIAVNILFYCIKHIKEIAWGKMQFEINNE